MDVTRNEFQDLVGAYALDACDPEEAAAIDAYLAEHADAAAEAERLRDAAAWLGAVGALNPPVALRDRLLAAAVVDPLPPVEALQQETNRFEALLDSLEPADLAVETYNGLSVRDLVAHIAIVDEAQGKYDDAAVILNQLLQKTEHDEAESTVSDKNNRALFLERLGTIYRENNKSQLAVDTFRKMFVLGDDNAVRGYQEIIETYRDSKQWQQATNAAEEAAKKFPADRDLQMVAASQQADMGNPGASIERVKSLLKGNSNDDQKVYVALAQMYSRLKQWDNAEESIDKAIEMSTKPEDKTYATFVAGSIYERQKKYDKAEEAFHKVLADDPKNAMALNYL